MEVENKAAKILLLVHFIFVSLALQGGWTPASYLFYNLIIFLVILWAIIDRTAHEPFFMLFYGELIAVVLDILLLIFHSPSMRYSYFSILMMVFNMFFRLYASFSVATEQTVRLERPASEKWALLGLQRAEEAIRRRMAPSDAQPRNRGEYEDVDAENPRANFGQPEFPYGQEPPAYAQVYKGPPKQ